jgi:Vitamin-D-receptor interacting Mediator subunit 4
VAPPEALPAFGLGKPARDPQSPNFVRRLRITMVNNPASSSHLAQRDQLGVPQPTDSTTNLLLGPLNHLNSVAQQLFQSLSPPHTKPPPPPPITALADADAALAAAVHLAHAHQTKQQRIDVLKAEVLALEDSWRTVIVQLEEGRRNLEAVITEGDARLNSIEQAKAGTSTPRFVRLLQKQVLCRCHSIS